MRLSQDELLLIAMFRGMTADARAVLTSIADPFNTPTSSADFAVAVDRTARKHARRLAVAASRGVVVPFAVRRA